MKIDLNVRGTRDLYPEQYFRLEHICKVWRRTALSYGFEEFEGPILETLDLYKIKSGDEIVRQLYYFTDKGGRTLALRPELTPSLARMVSKIQNLVSKPIKWFSISRCMRYEKPQKGRLREFFQFNVDVIGEDAATSDLDVISVAIDSLVNLGLDEKDFVVRINNRDFVSGFFENRGIDETKEKALYKIIDNARKVSETVTSKAMNDLQLDPEQRRGVDVYLGLKSSDDLRGLEEKNSGKDSLIHLFSLIESAGLTPYCDFDPTIVRGLDYYTGIVFEIFDRSEEMRAICGGGRYNHLLREFSGIDIPACGFGMGDVVLGQILSSKDLFPAYKRDIDYYLVRITDSELPALLRVARILRSQGKVVEYAYNSMPVKKQMSRASKIQVQKVLIFGENELAEGKVIEKDLATREERKIEIPE